MSDFKLTPFAKCGREDVGKGLRKKGKAWGSWGRYWNGKEDEGMTKTIKKEEFFNAC